MSDAPAPRALSIEDVMALARPRQTSARVCVAGDLAVEAEQLAAEIDRLDRIPRTSLADSGGERHALAAKLDEIIELMRGAEVEFTFRDIGNKAFSDLKARFPSQDPNLRWDLDGMAPELVAKACVSPAMTLEQSLTLHEKLPRQSRDALWAAAWDACDGENRIPTSRAVSAMTSGSGAR